MIQIDSPSGLIRIAKTKSTPEFQACLAHIKSYGCRWDKENNLWHAPQFFDPQAFFLSAQAQKIPIIHASLSAKSSPNVRAISSQTSATGEQRTFAEEIQLEIRRLHNAVEVRKNPQTIVADYQAVERKIETFKSLTSMTIQEFESSMEQISKLIFQKLD